MKPEMNLHYVGVGLYIAITLRSILVASHGIIRNFFIVQGDLFIAHGDLLINCTRD
jgi:hypothetical protein